MIKKLIGIFVVVAVVVIIVIAAIRRDNFQSMVLRDEVMDQTIPTAETPADEPVVPTVEVTDSVTVEIPDSIK